MHPTGLCRDGQRRALFVTHSLDRRYADKFGVCNGVKPQRFFLCDLFIFVFRFITFAFSTSVFAFDRVFCLVCVFACLCVLSLPWFCFHPPVQRLGQCALNKVLPNKLLANMCVSMR